MENRPRGPIITEVSVPDGDLEIVPGELEDNRYYRWDSHCIRPRWGG